MPAKGLLDSPLGARTTPLPHKMDMLKEAMMELPHPTGVGDAHSPHCDAAVLHAPGECQYCDLYPAWQRYRQVAGIAFTGHEPQQDETMCPSEIRRSIHVIENWGGNVPRKDT